MSILGEYLQRVKAERDEAVKLLREARDTLCSRCTSTDDYGLAVIKRIDDFLAKYDLPEDYDEG